jgi:hypothetical protein
MHYTKYHRLGEEAHRLTAMIMYSAWCFSKNRICNKLLAGSLIYKHYFLLELDVYKKKGVRPCYQNLSSDLNFFGFISIYFRYLAVIRMLIIMIEENVYYSEMDSQEVTCGVALFIQTLAVKLY